MERNIFYFCRCVVENDISLLSQRFWLHSMHSVGLAEKVMSLTFRRNINLHMFRDELMVKKGFGRAQCTSQIKAVLDDSFITVDATSLDQRSHESRNSRIALSLVIFRTVVISHQWRNPYIRLAWKYLIFFSLRWNSQIIHFICLNPQDKVMTVDSGKINSQSKHDLICHVAKVKATTSAHSMAT